MNLKGIGTMAVFCVLEMEDAANLSFNASPTPLEYNDIKFSRDNKSQFDGARTNNIFANTISGASSEIDKS
ncbi:hypothetical protein [Bartonella senegalensis]|uniref:hypothetical protein n=1 Tax=Bartonella senegalensis TaxID=1468418 RepID=UPI0002E992D4|nr:hypothetical protein [Bartonella senegalensis]